MVPGKATPKVRPIVTLLLLSVPSPFFLSAALDDEDDGDVVASLLFTVLC